MPIPLNTSTMATSQIWFPFPLSANVDSTACHIRPADFGDLMQIAEVLASSFYPPLGWKRWLYPVFRFSIYEDLKQRLQSAQNYYRCLAAIAPTHNAAQNQVIGTVEISHRHTGLWSFNRPQQIYLSNLAVLEGCRRRGIARQLLTSAEKQALDWGFRELYLHVMMDNTRAQQLYQSMGYQIQQVETTLLSLMNIQPSRLLLKKVLDR